MNFRSRWIHMGKIEIMRNGVLVTGLSVNWQSLIFTVKTTNFLCRHSIHLRLDKHHILKTLVVLGTLFLWFMGRSLTLSLISSCMDWIKVAQVLSLQYVDCFFWVLLENHPGLPGFGWDFFALVSLSWLVPHY